MRDLIGRILLLFVLIVSNKGLSAQEDLLPLLELSSPCDLGIFGKGPSLVEIPRGSAITVQFEILETVYVADLYAIQEGYIRNGVKRMDAPSEVIRLPFYLESGSKVLEPGTYIFNYFPNWKYCEPKCIIHLLEKMFDADSYKACGAFVATDEEPILPAENVVFNYIWALGIHIGSPLGTPPDLLNSQATAEGSRLSNEAGCGLSAKANPSQNNLGFVLLFLLGSLIYIRRLSILR